MTVEKPKPKQLLRPITTGADSAMNQSQFLAITCNSLEAREESRAHGAIGFGFDSHGLKNWRESFKPITKRGNRNHVITFDMQLEQFSNVMWNVLIFWFRLSYIAFNISIVSSLARMRSTFDSKFSGISTTSTTSEFTTTEEFELDKISLALFSSGELPEVLESLLFLAFLLEFIRTTSRKSLLKSETLGNGKKTRLLTPHTSTQSPLCCCCFLLWHLVLKRLRWKSWTCVC